MSLVRARTLPVALIDIKAINVLYFLSQSVHRKLAARPRKHSCWNVSHNRQHVALIDAHHEPFEYL